MASLWKQKKSKFWTACFRDHRGRQYKISTKTTDREKAQRIASLYERKVRSPGQFRNTPTYKSWAMMLQRCCNQYATNYHNYGGRGIEVCKEWHHFKPFLEDMGERPKGTSLGRIDHNKGYFSGNCKWQTPKEHGASKRRPCE